MVEERIKCDLLIRDCTALVEGMLVKEHMAIAIEDGKILDILPEAEADKYEAKEIVKEQDKLWLPGLVDAHMHTGQQLLKGKVLDELPMIWTRIMLPFESTMTAEKMLAEMSANAPSDDKESEDAQTTETENTNASDDVSDGVSDAAEDTPAATDTQSVESDSEDVQ